MTHAIFVFRDKMHKLPSQEELLQRYAYDPFTGNLYHKVRVSNAMRENTLVCNADVQGYMRTKIKGKTYKLHRIIWKMVYNEEPNIIDHINRNKADNRITNLRSVTARENMWNKEKYDNLLIGVRVRKLRSGYAYYSYIRYNGKRYYLGKFATAEDARKRYLEVHNASCKELSLLRSY
jgi:hypothetical protein